MWDTSAVAALDAVVLVERLAMYSALADERCRRHQEQLASAEEVTRALRREAVSGGPGATER